MDTSTSIDNVNNDLPIIMTKQKLADMILNFLGKKEKIVFDKNISFLLNHNQIEQFYFLLDTKLQKERNIAIDHFLVSVSYNDNTKREIAGIDALGKFLETRHVYPKSITMSWNLILNFPNSETIETQNIDLTYLINDNEKNNRSSDINEGKVILTIQHTNQAWGIEVLNLFKSHIENLTLTKPKLYYRLRTLKSLFSFGNIIFLFGVTIGASSFVLSLKSVDSSKYYYSDYYYSIAATANSLNRDEVLITDLAIQKMNAKDTENTGTNLITSKKLKDILLTVSTKKTNEDRFPYKIALNALAFIIGASLIYYYLKYAVKYYGADSHILITKLAEDRYKHEVETKNKLGYISLGFIVSTIILGLIVNWTYSFI